MNTLLGILGDILSTRSQLQFYVYLWLVITWVGVFANHMTWKRIRQVFTYVGGTLLTLNFSMLYRLRTTAQSTTQAVNTTLAISILVLIAVLGGLMMALAINSRARQPRGWLFQKTTDELRNFATFIEERVNPIIFLRSLADRFEKQAEEVSPASQLTAVLEQLHNGEV